MEAGAVEAAEAPSAKSLEMGAPLCMVPAQAAAAEYLPGVLSTQAQLAEVVLHILGEVERQGGKPPEQQVERARTAEHHLIAGPAAEAAHRTLAQEPAEKAAKVDFPAEAAAARGQRRPGRAEPAARVGQDELR